MECKFPECGRVIGKKRSDGARQYCKAHYSQLRKRDFDESRLKPIRTDKAPEGFNTCSRCDEVKELTHFQKGASHCKICDANDRRLKTYGLSPGEFIRMLEEQEQSCAICQSIMDCPLVDHDHQTGVVRGLLCVNCNFGLGSFQDNIDFLSNAIGYLNKGGGG